MTFPGLTDAMKAMDDSMVQHGVNGWQLVYYSWNRKTGDATLLYEHTSGESRSVTLHQSTYRTGKADQVDEPEDF